MQRHPIINLITVKLATAFLCTLIGFATIGSSLAADTSAAPASAQPADDHTELGEKMSALSRAFKKLRQQVADAAQNDASLQLVATVRENAEASLALEPEKTADLPAAERNAFKAAFVERMEAFVTETAKLEAALRAGDNATATQIVQALADAQKQGHQEFRRKKKS